VLAMVLTMTLVVTTPAFAQFDLKDFNTAKPIPGHPDFAITDKGRLVMGRCDSIQVQHRVEAQRRYFQDWIRRRCGKGVQSGRTLVFADQDRWLSSYPGTYRLASGRWIAHPQIHNPISPAV
jgi:hypothetical protein